MPEWEPFAIAVHRYHDNYQELQSMLLQQAVPEIRSCIIFSTYSSAAGSETMKSAIFDFLKGVGHIFILASMIPFHH
jgi:hypothetical protein